MNILRTILLFLILFSYTLVFANENLTNVNVKSLNILRTDEINNFPIADKKHLQLQNQLIGDNRK